MLMHIPKLLTPELIRLLMEMGHGEELLICDANYPAMTGAGERQYITGCHIDELLEIILYYFPLDRAVAYAAVVMDSCPNERLERYTSLVEIGGSRLDTMDRFTFYDRARGAVAKVVTNDTTRGGNILIRKGVVTETDLLTITEK